MSDGSSGAALHRRADEPHVPPSQREGARQGARRLPRVLHEQPAAVLLVDLEDGVLVHADPAATALAPGVVLPAPPEAWSDAAGLCAADGTPFPPGRGPVALAAAGSPVTGVLARLRDTAVWVSAVPVPSDRGRRALVVLLPLDAGPDDVVEAAVRDRAVIAAGLSFTLTDPNQPDDPLVFVNPAFERTTGYSTAEVLGRNCRFLQCADTDPSAVARIRGLLARQEHGTVTLLNQRRDGTAFWNELSLSPVYDGDGRLTHFVGIQSDVTARVLAEQERERQVVAEQRAREDAERAQRRLALLAEATSMLAATLDVDESLDRLTRLVVPMLADFCTVHLLTPDGRVQRVAATHRDPDKVELLRRLEELQPTGLSDDSETAEVLRGGPPQLLPDITPDMVRKAVSDDELYAVYEQIGVGSGLIVPLQARSQVLGALGLFTDGSRRFTEEDLDTAADLARRAALTVDNARLYQREHDVALSLQRSLLPTLPDVRGLDIASVYVPGSATAEVGGDWYDLFPLPDGAVGLAVGDVMGHDLTAAVAMGQLRSVLQSYAWQGSAPAVVLDRLDQLVQGLAMAQLATCLYGRLELPAQGQDGVLRLANAGHLPPALRRGDGHVRLLTSGQSVLVGAALGVERDETEERVGPGTVLVLYTDGLVEHRGRDVTDGLAALQQALARAPDGGAQAVLDSLLGELVEGDLEDDVAVLVVRLVP